MMIEELDKPGTVLSGTQDIRPWLGIGLLILGVGVAFWVLTQILRLFSTPEAFQPFLDLIPEDLTIKWTTGNVTIPAQLLAYAIPFTLLLLATGFAHLFIIQGVNLVQSNPHLWRKP